MRSWVFVGFQDLRFGVNPSFRSFQFGGDEELLRRGVVLDAQDIRLAANLAVFDVVLAASGGLINGSSVPFSAGSALETGLHRLTEHTSEPRRLRSEV